MSAWRAAASLAVSLVLGLGVPWVGIRMLWPGLSAGNGVSNFRGRPVHTGLGVVWLLWAGAAIIAGGVASGLSGEDSDSVLQVLMLAGPLALVVFALGVVDDAYGSSDAKGFRGHLAALRRGRLTTGGAKLLGISVASLVVALVMGRVAPWGDAVLSIRENAVAYLAVALAAGAAIALTSNFVNLTDLRPGRALKVYSLLAVAGIASTVFGLGQTRPDALTWALDIAGLFVVLLGPVVAVWRFDLGEVGMLGDAGANPMGAVAGMLIVAGLPLWGLLGYLVLMLGLNLVSERVSFSEVIEGNRVLRWFDNVGRLPQ